MFARCESLVSLGAKLPSCDTPFSRPTRRSVCACGCWCMTYGKYSLSKAQPNRVRGTAGAPIFTPVNVQLSLLPVTRGIRCSAAQLARGELCASPFKTTAADLFLSYTGHAALSRSTSAAALLQQQLDMSTRPTLAVAVCGAEPHRKPPNLSLHLLELVATSQHIAGCPAGKESHPHLNVT